MEKIIQGIFIAIICVVLVPMQAITEEVLEENFGWTLNLTETWVMADYDPDQGIASFSDGEGHAIMQIIVRNAEQNGDDPAESLRQTLTALGAQADFGTFSFSGHDAAFADATWSIGNGIPVRGYVVAIDDKPRISGAQEYPLDYLIMSFSLESEYDMYHDFLLSNLDAFSPLESEYQLPGIISQLIRDSGGNSLQPYRRGVIRNAPLGMSPDRLSPLAQMDFSGGSQADIEAATATIEREARILNQFAQAPDEIKTMAWRRYYQMIYKDSLYDMRQVSETIAGRLESHGIIRSEYPSEILAWLQGFEYYRSGTLSDIEPAQVCLNNEAGDCDSLALMYMAVLDHLGIDSLLMISHKHGHSLVGVDTAGPGARFNFLDTAWLVAELTVDVNIGQIAADQSNPADWMGFDMDFHPEW